MKYLKIITFWIIHKEATYGIPINGIESDEIFKIIPFWIIHKEAKIAISSTGTCHTRFTQSFC